MALLQDGKATAGNAAVDPTKSLRVNLVQRTAKNYTLSAQTGTIAAALGANSSVFVMRLDPGAGPVYAFIERIHIQYTTIVAYTTPITAGRRLAVFRGSGGAASGGTGLATATRKLSSGATSEVDVANGGDARIATTGALTVTPITFEADPLRQVSLVHVGTAGAHYEAVLEFSASESAPIILEPGQLLAIRNPAAMDAAGTWQLQVSVDWHEGSLLTATADA